MNVSALNLRALRVAGTTAARRAVTDRGAQFFTFALYGIIVSTMTAIYRAAARSNGGEVAGYSGRALTWYVLASEAVTVCLASRLISDVASAITSGEIATELVRPVSVVRQRLGEQVGLAVPRLAICAATGLVLGVVLVGQPPSWPAVGWAVPSLGLAITCNIAAQHVFAGAAFWLRNTGAAWFLYQKFVFMIGGMLLPLEVLPAWLGHVAHWTPFPSMAYAPGRLASGHVEPRTLLVQGLWTVSMIASAELVFRLGERRIEVSGG